MTLPEEGRQAELRPCAHSTHVAECVDGELLHFCHETGCPNNVPHRYTRAGTKVYRSYSDYCD